MSSFSCLVSKGLVIEEIHLRSGSDVPPIEQLVFSCRDAAIASIVKGDTGDLGFR